MGNTAQRFTNTRLGRRQEVAGARVHRRHGDARLSRDNRRSARRTQRQSRSGAGLCKATADEFPREPREYSIRACNCLLRGVCEARSVTDRRGSRRREDSVRTGLKGDGSAEPFVPPCKVAPPSPPTLALTTMRRTVYFDPSLSISSLGLASEFCRQLQACEVGFSRPARPRQID